MDALEMVREGYGAGQIKRMLEAARAQMKIYVAVDTLEYLRRGGRISRTTAAIGTVMNIKPVLKLDVSTLDTYKKCRGFGLAKKAMLEAMRRELDTVFAQRQARGEVYLLAASSSAAQATEEWVKEIRQAFPLFLQAGQNRRSRLICRALTGRRETGCSRRRGSRSGRRLRFSMWQLRRSCC